MQNSDDELQRVALDLLPVAVYVVRRDGTFVTGNQKLAELLAIEIGRLREYNISSFYARPGDREELLAALEANDTIEKQVVTFRVNNRFLQVQVFCRAIRTGDGAATTYMGVLHEITAEANYHHVFDEHLEVGVYTLDADDRVVRANEGFARIHGYESASAIVRRNVRDFYADPADATRIREQIETAGALVREAVKLKRHDGRLFTAHVTAIPFMVNGVYVGRGGVIEDRSAELETEKLVDDAPVGFYYVEVRDGRDIVTACNKTFADVHDYDWVIRDSSGLRTEGRNGAARHSIGRRGPRVVRRG